MLCECYKNWGNAELIITQSMRGLVIPGFRNSVWLKYDTFDDIEVVATIFNIVINKYICVKLLGSEICIPYLDVNENVFRSRRLHGQEVIQWFNKQTGDYDTETELYLCDGNIYVPHVQE